MSAIENEKLEVYKEQPKTVRTVDFLDFHLQLLSSTII